MAMRRTRRDPEPGEFRDQLSNYNPPEFSGELERAISQDTMADVVISPFLQAGPEATIQQVVEMMNEHKTACVVIVKDRRPVGIFSEHDTMMRLADRYKQIKDLPVSKVMTPDPEVAFETDSPTRVLNMMVTGDFRHVPVVDADGCIKGIIGTRRLIAYLVNFFPGMSG